MRVGVGGAAVGAASGGFSTVSTLGSVPDGPMTLIATGLILLAARLDLAQLLDWACDLGAASSSDESTRFGGKSTFCTLPVTSCIAAGSAWVTAGSNGVAPLLSLLSVVGVAAGTSGASEVGASGGSVVACVVLASSA